MAMDGWPGPKLASSDASRSMEELPAPGVIPLLDRFIGGFEGSGNAVNPKGVEILTSGKSVPVAGWYASVALPTIKRLLKRTRKQMVGP